jgi:hypothetical protein
MTLLSELLQAGKINEGRDLLKKAIEGDSTDETRVTLEFQLAQSYVKTGEWAEARRYAQSAITRYATLKKPDKKGEGKDVFSGYDPESAMNSATWVLQQVEQWEKAPLLLEPKEVVLHFRGAKEPVRSYFNLRSYRDFTATWESTDKSVKVVQLASPHGYEDQTRPRFGVEVTPEAVDKEYPLELIVKVKEFPDLTLKIPIKMQKTETGGVEE